MDKITELKTLYAKGSKHSNYQVLSKRLSLLIGNNIEVKSRYESERLRFYFRKLKCKDKIIVDIGGNTGYFTFELIEYWSPTFSTIIEGNKAHADFVKLASDRYLSNLIKYKL